jgi:hypothetical protein
MVADRSARRIAAMTFVILALGAATAPGAWAASTHHRKHSAAPQPVLNCGGAGVTAAYCIPQQSVFSFAAVQTGRACTLSVGVRVLPVLEQGPRGRVDLVLRGDGRTDRSLRRSASPKIARDGRVSVVFRSLRPGRYRITGWYAGDSVRVASTHVSRGVVLACR